MSEATKIPPGVTAVLTNSRGQVVADATCFERGFPAGFTLVEAQRQRAHLAACRNYIFGACNEDLAAEIIKGYPGAEGLVNSLLSNHGFRLHYIEHGHEPESKID